jgi:hypothetical protein
MPRRSERSSRVGSGAPMSSPRKARHVRPTGPHGSGSELTE